jgi:signal transduction histidine kinase
MQILIVILTLMVIIIGVILNRITLYSIRKNTERAKDIATIMQHTLNENNYVIRLSLQNRLADNMFGNFLPHEGMTYEESLNYIHPEDKHIYMAFMNRLVKGAKTAECMFRWDRSTNEHKHDWRYLRDVGIVEYDEQDKNKPINFYCTIYDQTEQMLLEKEELELTDRYRKLFEQSIVGQAFYDKDGYLLTANKKLREILKFKGDNDPFYHRFPLFDIPNFRFITYKDEKEDLYFCTRTTITEREVDCYTEIRIHPIYNDDKQLEMFTLYIRDITQERELYHQQKENEAQIQRTNKEIEEYENELKYLMENIEMRFFRASFIKREIIFYKEMSVPERKMTFEELTDSILELPFKKGEMSVDEYFCEQKTMLTHTKPFFFKNNSETEWHFVDSIPLFNEEGKLIGTYGVVRNITKLINKQELLKEETERANQSGLRKSAFLANMSHEIRTPLNAIVGFSEVLHMLGTDEERAQIINVINNNCDMLLRLVNDILALSSIESGGIKVEPTKTDFAQCFNSMAMSLSKRVQNPAIEFISESPYPTFITTIDGGRIQQVVTNFVTNAIKYTKKGHIKIGYEKQVRHNNDGLYIYCEDTGAGIPKEHQKKVFDRFVKLNDFVQGTGLGLSICKAIVDNCNGEIGVTSEGKGCGSTFWLWIPCKEETTI